VDRRAIEETRLVLQRIRKDARAYDPEQARAAIDSLTETLALALDAIGRIDHEPAHRSFDHGMRAEQVVAHHAIDRNIMNFCHRVHLRAPKVETPPV